MNDQDLEKKWKEMAKETFKRFVDENIGLDSEARPKCYGSGDDRSYCLFCEWQSSC